jgi:DHA2 family multidrug resistance protein-like MFS transporter
MLPSAGAFIVGSMLAPMLVRHVSAAHVVSGGLLLAAHRPGHADAGQDASSLALLIAGSVTMDVGLALVIVLATDLIVASTAPERAGAASGISETGAELGGALGIAVLGSVGAAIYRGEMANAIPADAPHAAAEAARETLGGAVQAADQLPVRLLDDAVAAFTHALHVCRPPPRRARRRRRGPQRLPAARDEPRRGHRRSRGRRRPRPRRPGDRGAGVVSVRAGGGCRG